MQPTEMTVISQNIGFLGCGQMAGALISGIINSKLADPKQLFGFDPSPQTVKLSLTSKGGVACASNADVAKRAQVLFLCVKPQFMNAVLNELKAANVITPKHLIVSIAAGTTIASIVTGIGFEKARVIRVMPNTPCLVQTSASAYACGKYATEQDAKLVEGIFKSVGVTFKLEEKLIDAVTGLSGSGPAYVYLIIEGLADGGVKAGLPRNIAQTLAAQTVLGAAKMVLETKKHPGELKDMVTSPAGTTIAGISELENRGVRAAMINAVKAAADRATELGRSKL
jgi:pyrroline-5-carboxylate reductase